MNNMILLGTFIALILGGCSQQKLTPAEKQLKLAKEEANNVEHVKEPDFIFYANTVTPEFGTIHNINFPSSLRVTKKTLEVELPYLGQFYIRPIILDQEIPIKLYSSQFVYTVQYDEKKDEYNVAIVPQDMQRLVNDNIIFKMKLKTDGSASLSVKTDNRDEISYTGFYR